MNISELNFQKSTPPTSRHPALPGASGGKRKQKTWRRSFRQGQPGAACLPGRGAASTWLYRIATNTAIDKMRTASFRQEAQLDGLDETNEPEDIDLWSGEETPSLEQQIMRNEMYECFIDYVKRLPGTIAPWWCSANWKNCPTARSPISWG
jgi:RNA polymerase sigma-70 factor (ECF subfamily)